MVKHIDGVIYGDVVYDERGDRYYFLCEWCETGIHGGPNSESFVIIKADQHEQECTAKPNNKTDT